MRGLIISIQQPEHWPWSGFFNKVVNVDKVILLDNVQFKKRYFENRIKIRNQKGWQWLRIPVKTKGKYLQKISEVEIDNTPNWQSDCLKAIELNYGKASYFKEYFPKINALYNRGWSKLADLNIETIKIIASLAGIKKEFLLASKLGIEGIGSGLLLNICKKVQAKIYLSGKFGKNYLDESHFRKAGVKIFYQDFHHPIYRQFHNGFAPNMSTIDLLFNEGKRSLNVIKSGFVLEK